MFHDRFGNLKRQFKVDMNGTIKDGVLTLEEDFTELEGKTIGVEKFLKGLFSDLCKRSFQRN